MPSQADAGVPCAKEDCGPLRAVAAESRPPARWGIWLLAAVGVLAVLLWANAKVVRGEKSATFDAAGFFCPYFMLVADSLRQGELLLWSPFSNAGVPTGVDPQVGALSPLVLATAAITGPHELGFRIYWLGIWALGGLGVLVLARHFSAPVWAGCLGAIGFMFSGVYIGHAQHTCFLEGISLLPWVIWRLDVAVRQRRLMPCAQAGAIWGLSALAGYPGVVIGACLYAAMWYAGGVLLAGGEEAAGWRSRWGKKLLRLGLGLTVFLGVGAVVSSPVFLGFMVESRGYSHRFGPMPRYVATSDNDLAPGALTTFSSPYLAHVKCINPDLWPSTDGSTCSIYLFPGLLAIGLMGLWNRPRDAWRWFLLGLAAFWLVAAMGGTLPLRGWLYDFLPPMRYFRHSGVFRCYWLLSIVLLAVVAARDLALAGVEGNRAWRRLAVLSVLVGLGGPATFAWLCSSVANVGEGFLLDWARRQLVLGFAGIAVLALLGWWARTSVRNRLVLPGLIALAIVDAGYTVAVMEPLIYCPRSYFDFGEANHVSSLDLSKRGLSREPMYAGMTCGMSDNIHLLTKVPVLFGYNPLLNLWHVAYLANPVLAASACGPQRTWFSRQAVEVPPNDEAFGLHAQRVRQLGRPCLVVLPKIPGDPGTHAGVSEATARRIQALPAAEPIDVQLEKYTPRELILTTNCPADGWLLVTDRWARGWRVRVNGEPKPIQLGNFLFRAVAVKAGANRLHFRYRPFGYPLLLIASWAAMAAIGAGALAGAARRKWRSARKTAVSHQRPAVRPPHACARSLDSALVSVVLPVYNEAEVLPELLARIAATLERCGARWEAIFVDDGSTDGSDDVLDELAAADARVRVVHFSRNFGHQAAVQAGLTHAAGDAVALMDSDMQDSPESLAEFLIAWQEGYDVVYAIRTGRKENVLKRACFAAFHGFISRVSSVNIPPNAGNFGLVDRRVAREIAAMGETDRYFPGLRRWVGFRQVGIEVERSPRYDGCPRVSFFGLCRVAKTAVFSFSTFPLLFFQLLGVAAIMVFAGFAGFALYCKLFTGLAIPGWATHVILGSFFGAINCLGVSVLGEYVIRIYDQVRGRPTYVVDRTVNLRSDAEAGHHPRRSISLYSRKLPA